MDKRVLTSIGVSIFFGVTALSVMLVSPASAQTTGKVTEARHRVDVPSDVVVKERHISLLKFALNLRPEQEPFWAPVEAALHDMARWQASSDLDATGRAASAVVLRLKRIAALAVPLIKALDDSQRRNMMMLARSAGLEMLVASK